MPTCARLTPVAGRGGLACEGVTPTRCAPPVVGGGRVVKEHRQLVADDGPLWAHAVVRDIPAVRGRKRLF